MPPALAPPEVWQPLGPLGAECLCTLLSDSPLSTFRTDYLTLLLQHRRLVPPALLVPVLSHPRFQLHLPGEGAAILGERGRWLALQNPAWHAFVTATHPSQDLATWENGTLHERRFFLQRLHQDDPEQARQLLAAALPTEPPAAQAALLSELEHQLSAADAPLLESYLTSKSKEVRQTVGPMLVRLPGNALLERLWQRALPLLTCLRSPAGPPKLLVQLPEGWDKTWLHDGIEQRTTDGEHGERAGWLGQLLALLPPGRWTRQLGLTAAELLALAETSEWTPLLLKSWARATYLHRDKKFAAPLLLRHFAEPGQLDHQLVTHLTWVLTEAEKIDLLRIQLPPHADKLPAFLPEFLKCIFMPWPSDIVEAALQFIRHELAPASINPYTEAHQRLTTLLYRLTHYAPYSQATHCTAVLQLVAADYPPLAPLLASVGEALHFRQQLDASLLESA